MTLSKAQAQSDRYAGVETLTLAAFALRDLSRKGLDLFVVGGGGTLATVSSHAIRA